ncbi:MAG TPA: ribosome small subunit-dependent GTPase A [Tissierellales bacterium]|nr:ribosome small subunit-dependent GTPase A [Tissierellales bacterium]
MLEGIIIKGIGGFYYVKTDEGIYESRARGVFREEKITPLIGDRVKIRINPEDNTGYIEEIKNRESQLLRPPVANVKQAIVVMSVKKPNINYWLLDRFLLSIEHEKLNAVICINKTDLITDSEKKEIKKIYEKIGYKVIFTSTVDNAGIDELKDVLKDEVTVLAGPSGVGKSSLLNVIQPDLKLETGGISNKTKRGKHTTRHVELLELDMGGYVLDTPGFSALDLSFINKKEELRNYFKEMKDVNYLCRFDSCLHEKEPDCEIKNRLGTGVISNSRYKNYLKFLNEIENIRRY